jgi:hypothetical protein
MELVLPWVKKFSLIRTGLFSYHIAGYIQTLFHDQYSSVATWVARKRAK